MLSTLAQLSNPPFYASKTDIFWNCSQEIQFSVLILFQIYPQDIFQILTTALDRPSFWGKKNSWIWGRGLKQKVEIASDKFKSQSNYVVNLAMFLLYYLNTIAFSLS